MDTTTTTSSDRGPGLGPRCRFAAAVALGLAGVFSAGPALGQSRVGPQPLGNTATPMPDEVSEAKIDQNLGNDLPLDVAFRDQHGNHVVLGDYFDGEKPVVIDFAYFNCPLLCPMVQSGIADAVEGELARARVRTDRLVAALQQRVDVGDAIVLGSLAQLLIERVGGERALFDDHLITRDF